MTTRSSMSVKARCLIRFSSFSYACAIGWNRRLDTQDVRSIGTRMVTAWTVTARGPLQRTAQPRPSVSTDGPNRSRHVRVQRKMGGAREGRCASAGRRGRASTGGRSGSAASAGADGPAARCAGSAGADSAWAAARRRSTRPVKTARIQQSWLSGGANRPSHAGPAAARRQGSGRQGAHGPSSTQTHAAEARGAQAIRAAASAATIHRRSRFVPPRVISAHMVSAPAALDSSEPMRRLRRASPSSHSTVAPWQSHGNAQPMRV